MSHCRLISLRGIRKLAEVAPRLEELRAKSISIPLLNLLRELRRPSILSEECSLPFLRYLRTDIDPTADQAEVAAFLEPTSRQEHFEGFGTVGGDNDSRMVATPLFGTTSTDWKFSKSTFTDHHFAFVPYLLQRCPRLRKVPAVHIAHSSMRQLAESCPYLTHAHFVADETLRGTKIREEGFFGLEEEPRRRSHDEETAAEAGSSSLKDSAKIPSEDRKKTATLAELTEEQFADIERLCGGSDAQQDEVGFLRLQKIVFRKYEWMASITFERFVNVKSLSLNTVFMHPVVAWPPRLRDLTLENIDSLPDLASDWAVSFCNCRFLGFLKIDGSKLGMSTIDLQHFFDSLPVSLDSLDLNFVIHNMSSVSEPSAIIINHPRLRRFTFRGLPSVTTGLLSLQFGVLPRLCSIESDANGIRSPSSLLSALLAAAEVNPTLIRRLKIRDLTFGAFPHDALPFEAILAKASKVAMMDLPFVTNAHLALVAGLKHLRSLLLWHASITDEGAETICLSLPSLIGISITGSETLRGLAWAKHPKLAFLFLAGIGPRRKKIDSVPKADSSLKYLDFSAAQLPALRILYDLRSVPSPSCTLTRLRLGSFRILTL